MKKPDKVKAGYRPACQKVRRYLEIIQRKASEAGPAALEEIQREAGLALALIDRREKDWAS
ncbi:hypothetical protein J7443_17630 [Tropicibacter sp. R15_0]|uniref:hypothetical protein n=1 Tax=Tropicibacter sp. R15_0 TaxID=2821101 RepID=UPI001ADD049F|nr:hypothetical protein [Tropicibacter sp. R15_0]MBO9467069.1 hypothetical protein [Tropicibacter sp. R15_0]